MTAGAMPADGIRAPSAGTLPNRPGQPPTGAQSTSLDTRQQPRIRPPRHAQKAPTDPLTEHLRDARNRQELKRDLVAVTAEIADRCELEAEYVASRWFSDRSAALDDCTKVLVILDPKCGGGTARPLSCRTRGCPDCERARMTRVVDRFDKLVTGYTTEDGTVIEPMARPVFWTWAVRNVEQGTLWDGLVRLRRDFGRLRRRSIVKGGRCRWRWRDRGPTGELDGSPGHPCHPPIQTAACARDCPTRTGRHQSHCRTHPPKLLHRDGCPPGCAHAGHPKGRNCPAFRHEAIAGGVSAVEVTFNTERLTWHPHVHALVDAPWIGWAEMRDTWQAITCDQAKCRHGRTAGCTGAWTVWVAAIDAHDEDRRRGAIREVLKYVAKPAGITDSLDPDRIREFLWSTRGLRMVNGWGSLYRVRDPEDDPDAGDEGTELIRSGFMVYRVPTTCPCCGRPMTADDWAWPTTRDRLSAERVEGSYRYRWRPPPAPVMTPGISATQAAPPALPSNDAGLWSA